MTDDSSLPPTLRIASGIRFYKITDEEYMRPGHLIDNVVSQTEAAKAGEFVVSCFFKCS